MKRTIIKVEDLGYKHENENICAYCWEELKDEERQWAFNKPYHPKCRKKILKGYKEVL